MKIKQSRKFRSVNDNAELTSVVSMTFKLDSAVSTTMICLTSQCK